jgi:sugar phosphate isomerase/epimerase
MLFALSTHLFHNEKLTRAHLELAAAQGFSHVEIFATRSHVDYHNAHAVDELASWLRALRLEASTLHAPICDRFKDGKWGRAFSNASTSTADRQEAINETSLAMDAAKRLGAEIVVLHVGLPNEQAASSGLNDPGAATRSLEVIAEHAIKIGVRLALEVMPNALSTAGALLEAIDRLDDPTVGVCLDLGHAHLLGGAPEAIEQLSGHILTTHVHDNGGARDDHLVPFQGTIDWPATLMELWKVGYTGRLVFEVADRGDLTGVLTRTVGARDRLQGILDGLSEPFEFVEKS